MAISARDELRHLIDTLDDAECERAMDLLAPLAESPRSSDGPHCPDCHERDLDRLVWDEDGENVACERCGFCWSPNHGRPLQCR